MKGQNLDKEDNFFYPVSEDFVELDIHGYSENYMFTYTNNGICKSKEYHEWRKKFSELDIVDRRYWSDVNWNKPIELFLDFVCKPQMDSHNFIKSTIDALMSHYRYNDVNVVNVYSRKAGMCNSYDDGKIRFYIKNVDKYR